MRGEVVADVLDDVVHAEPGLADARLDAPAQHELLAEDGRHLRLSLGVEDALVAVPPLAVPDSRAGRFEILPCRPKLSVCFGG